MIQLAMVSVLALRGGDPAVELVTREIEYRHGEVALEGYLAYPKDAKGKLPGVLICHQWMGQSPYERMRAEETAKLGMVAFALDIYGKGVRPQDVPEAAKLATGYKTDRALLRARAHAGLEALRKVDVCDGSRIVVMGYCFGGTTALELARSGAPLAALATFHAGLIAELPEDAGRIRAKVLINHGADDPLVQKEVIDGVMTELRRDHVDWQVIFYGNAVHSFTNPEADARQVPALKYDKKADERSWALTRHLFEEAFG